METILDNIFIKENTKDIVIENIKAEEKVVVVLNNSRGQTLVEFVFLIAIIVGMSISIVRLSNAQIAKIWQNMVYVISEKEVTFP